MKHTIPLAAAALALALATTSTAQDVETPAAPSPGEIVDAAPYEDWVTIDPEDLVVMTLAPDAEGNARKVVIQLIGAPFSQGWVENIRTLARAEYWDGSEVLRVQDNYVTQWGQPDPEMGVDPKPVPEGLNVMTEADYVSTNDDITDVLMARTPEADIARILAEGEGSAEYGIKMRLRAILGEDTYSEGGALFCSGWPLASAGRELASDIWPVHCYGMVGVGRNYSPDTGDASQLYTVIGHAPRHLDRNIALVGRIVEGMEHLSNLPRGKGPLGFYEDPARRVPILSVRIGADLPENEKPRFEYLSTESASFAAYAEARANRRDPFFIVPAGGADICNIPVPVRSFELMDEGE
ncbi:peptidylprolyl isomerase [Alteriqipengyuania sp.]|uniref:peptidylprolyl isomerase n=1 Tax=Alteriqipengyuania sp. TaxID=2800692 RepID=UPI003512D1A2